MSGSLLICFVSKFAKIQLRESAFSSCACLFSVLVLVYVEILYHDWTSHKTFLICRQNCRFSPNLKTNCPISWSGKGPVVQKAPKFLMEARMCWSFHMSHKKGCTLYWLPDLCKGNRIDLINPCIFNSLYTSLIYALWTMKSPLRGTSSCSNQDFTGWESVVFFLTSYCEQLVTNDPS